MVKILRLLFTIAIFSAAYYWNSQDMQMGWFAFTGVILLVWIVWSLFANFVSKVYRNKKGLPPKEKHSYALPNTMAKAMKNVDLRTQYESSIMSTFLIMIGITSMAIYFIFLTEVSLIMKILTGMNSLFGLFFMYSNLVTVYQQYVIYMQTQDMTKEGMKTGEMLSIEEVGIPTLVQTDHPTKPADTIERRDSQNA